MSGINFWVTNNMVFSIKPSVFKLRRHLADLWIAKKKLGTLELCAHFGQPTAAGSLNLHKINFFFAASTYQNSFILSETIVPQIF